MADEQALRARWRSEAPTLQLPALLPPLFLEVSQVGLASRPLQRLSCLARATPHCLPLAAPAYPACTASGAPPMRAQDYDADTGDAGVWDVPACCVWAQPGLVPTTAAQGPAAAPGGACPPGASPFAQAAAKVRVPPQGTAPALAASCAALWHMIHVPLCACAKAPAAPRMPQLCADLASSPFSLWAGKTLQPASVPAAAAAWLQGTGPTVRPTPREQQQGGQQQPKQQPAGTVAAPPASPPPANTPWAAASIAWAAASQAAPAPACLSQPRCPSTVVQHHLRASPAPPPPGGIKPGPAPPASLPASGAPTALGPAAPSAGQPSAPLALYAPSAVGVQLHGVHGQGSRHADHAAAVGPGAGGGGAGNRGQHAHAGAAAADPRLAAIMARRAAARPQERQLNAHVAALLLKVQVRGPWWCARQPATASRGQLGPS